MIRAGLPGKPVLERLLLVFLHDLLQHGLVVLERAARDCNVHLVRDKPQHECARRLDAAVQIDRAEQRFGRIRQDRRPLAPAAGLLAVAQPDLLRDAEFPRDLAQRALAHDRRAQLGQVALGQLGIVRKQVIRRDKAQYGIAKELQPLIVVQVACAMLVGIGRVGHRGLVQRLVLKLIVDVQHVCFTSSTALPARLSGSNASYSAMVMYFMFSETA